MRRGKKIASYGDFCLTDLDHEVPFIALEMEGSVFLDPDSDRMTSNPEVIGPNSHFLSANHPRIVAAARAENAATCRLKLSGQFSTDFVVLSGHAHFCYVLALGADYATFAPNDS